MQLDTVAKRYGQRPSALAGLHPEDPLALGFDYAIAVRALLAADEADQEDGERRAGQLGPGAVVADNMPVDAMIRF